MQNSTLLEGVSDAEYGAEARAVKKIIDVPNPPIDGVPVKLCGVDAIVPGLKAKHLKKFKDSLHKIANVDPTMSASDFMDLALPVIHAALTRNYPNLSLDDTFELIDTQNLEGVLMGMLGRSGYKKAKPGE